MVEVSEGFIKLSQDNARHVYCRIEAGEYVFLDDRIIEFDFDDVTHPDWFNIGTTCSNRFSFEVRYEGAALNVRDTVKPFISFDNKEWCPLGVFFVARRYVRGNYASITCYDKMYGLDMEYISELALPTDTVKIMEELCAQTGLQCADKGAAYEVKELPSECSVRDMIGYIACLNRACAKFDRNGALVFKSYAVGDFVLAEKNCMGIRRNMEKSVITCLKADTGREILTEGSGAEISTLEVYNPLMTQERLHILWSMLRPFSFYGAEIEMQGLPYLESGEGINLMEKGLMYPLVISEIELHYDGGLTARLYSKNKSYADAVVRTDDLEEALKSLRAMYLTFSNEKQIIVSDSPVIVADFEFEVTGKSFAQVDVNFTMDSGSADFLMISVSVNGVKAARTAARSVTGATKELIHYYHLAGNLPKGKNRIFITMQTKTGSAYILPSQLFATVVGHGFEGTGGSARNRVSAYDELEPLGMSDMIFALSPQTAYHTAE